MACLRTLLTLTLLCWACCRAERPRPRCPSDAAPKRCVPQQYLGQDEYFYTVDGLNLTIKFTESSYASYFMLTCAKDLTLDNSALPRFESQLRANGTLLLNCPPPRDSYASALGRLNVVVLDMLKLYGPGDVTDTHLAALSRLRELELFAAHLLPSAWAALPALRNLTMEFVPLPPQELLSLPQTLERLKLFAMNTSLPATVLDRLPALRHLYVFGWDEPHPAPWTGCTALESLQLYRLAAKELPAGWLQRCNQMQELHVAHAWQLSQLHTESLRGAHNLEELRLVGCALMSLPAGLLDHAVKLRRLDLSWNRLHELPVALFVMTKSLQELDLSKNELTTAVFRSLQSVTSLTKLKLSDNIHLKDTCSGNVSGTVRGWSPLLHLRRLTELHLCNTGARMICRDWRANMSLSKLNLEQNSFTSISYADLQFNNPVEVNFKRNHIRKLYYTRADYELVTQGATSSARMQLDENTFSCDCDSYWAARALRERPDHLQLSSASCVHGGQLSQLNAEPDCRA